MILDLTNDFKGMGLETGYEKKRELNAQATRTMAKSGGRKSGVCRKQMYVGICMSLNGSSAPSVQHRMKQAQETYRKRHKVLVLFVVSRLNSACKFLVKG